MSTYAIAPSTLPARISHTTFSVSVYPLKNSARSSIDFASLKGHRLGRNGRLPALRDLQGLRSNQEFSEILSRRCLCLGRLDDDSCHGNHLAMYRR